MIAIVSEIAGRAIADVSCPLNVDGIVMLFINHGHFFSKEIVK